MQKLSDDLLGKDLRVCLFVDGKNYFVSGKVLDEDKEYLLLFDKHEGAICVRKKLIAFFREGVYYGKSKQRV